MLQVVKKIAICAGLLSLSACASVFSSYESDFSCKNSDHGGCAHPLDAYEEARNEDAPAFGVDKVKASIEIVDEHLGHEAHDHARTIELSDYQSYQDATYSELEALVAAPDTPVLAPAKTVRTLILPYTDPKSTERLYMPRYIYSVLENSHFVLGNYLTNEWNGLSLDALIGAASASSAEDSGAKE